MAANGNHGLSAAAKQVAEHASALTRLEVELAPLELKKKATSLGVGIGLGAGAAVFALLGLLWALATAIVAIALVVSVWAALLIMTGAFLIVAGIAGTLATGRLRRGTPPVPEEAIQEAKLTTEAIKR
jgi:Putative Actinobacterial Holin-X, holin superfamily III